MFVSGSLGAVLFALAAMNDAVLFHVKLGRWNLLWYAGALGVLFSAGKAMLPRDASSSSSSSSSSASARPPYARRNLFAEMDAALAEVAAHTHYYPDIWRGRGWSR